jgi:hypothetical protein
MLGSSPRDLVREKIGWSDRITSGLSGIVGRDALCGCRSGACQMHSQVRCLPSNVCSDPAPSRLTCYARQVSSQTRYAEALAAWGQILSVELLGSGVCVPSAPRVEVLEERGPSAGTATPRSSINRSSCFPESTQTNSTVVIDTTL